MVDFAVTVKGDEQNDAGEEKGFWVLHVDVAGNRFLIVREDKKFEWIPITECNFAKAHGPDQPTLVLPIPPPKSGIVTPAGAMPNRAERRREERNGGG